MRLYNLDLEHGDIHGDIHQHLCITTESERRFTIERCMLIANAEAREMLILTT